MNSDIDGDLNADADLYGNKDEHPNAYPVRNARRILLHPIQLGYIYRK